MVDCTSDRNDNARNYSSQFSFPSSMPVEINRLALEASQFEAIQRIYSEQCEIALQFSDMARDQKDAHDFLTSHLLDHTS